jgi:integrase
MRLFRRDGNETWYAQGYDAQGKRWQKSTYLQDYQAALKLARQWEREYVEPPKQSRTETVSDALAAMLQAKALDVRSGEGSQSTVDMYQEKAVSWVKYLGNGFLLSALTPGHVDGFIKSRLLDDISRHTVHKELVTLRLALKHAKRAGWWEGDIQSLLPVNFGQGYEPRRTWLTETQVDSLIRAYAEETDHAARVALLVACGARWGESERVLRSDISPDWSRIRLRGTKTEMAARVVPVVLHAHRRLLAFAAEQGQGVDGRLFLPWSHVQQSLGWACKRAGFGDLRVTPNDLRRTYGNWLRAAGIPSDLVAPSMGHVDSTMVERVYGRLSTDQLEASMARATNSSTGAAGAGFDGADTEKVGSKLTSDSSVNSGR